MKTKPKRIVNLRGMNWWIFHVWYAPHILCCLLFLGLTFPAALWAVFISERQGDRLVDWMTKKMDAWANQMHAAAERLSR